MTNQVLAVAKQAMAKHGVTPVDACVTLRHDDIPAIIEAPHGEVVAAAGAGVTAQGNLRAETPTATTVTDLLHQIGAS